MNVASTEAISSSLARSVHVSQGVLVVAIRSTRLQPWLGNSRVAHHHSYGLGIRASGGAINLPEYRVVRSLDP